MESHNYLPQQGIIKQRSKDIWVIIPIGHVIGRVGQGSIGQTLQARVGFSIQVKNQQIH